MQRLCFCRNEAHAQLVSILHLLDFCTYRACQHDCLISVQLVMIETNKIVWTQSNCGEKATVAYQVGLLCQLSSQPA